jgi:hypothetical protein
MNTWQLQYMRSRLKIESAVYVSAATTATLCGPIVDTKLYPRGLFHISVPTTNTGGITLFELVVSAASNMSSPAALATSGAIDADAANDQANLEYDEKQLAQMSSEASLAVGSGYRYVQARCTVGTIGDKCTVTTVLESHEQKDALTPATTIA